VLPKVVDRYSTNLSAVRHKTCTLWRVLRFTATLLRCVLCTSFTMILLESKDDLRILIDNAKPLNG